MAPAQPLSLTDTIAAAQAWWREAGVDMAYHDDPRAWLAPEPGPDDAPTATATVREAPPVARIGGDPATWPKDLEGFARWWLESSALESGPTRRRVSPRGPHRARMMILVEMPEADDEAVLLSGPEGRLIASLVRAMGLADDAVYLAAALPRHVPMPDWAALKADGLGALVGHHVALAAPERLLVLGSDVSSLLKHDPAQGAPDVSEMAIQPGSLPTLHSYAPGKLLDHPRLRAELWRRWLDWTGK